MNYLIIVRPIYLAIWPPPSIHHHHLLYSASKKPNKALKTPWPLTPANPPPAPAHLPIMSSAGSIACGAPPQIHLGGITSQPGQAGEQSMTADTAIYNSVVSPHQAVGDQFNHNHETFWLEGKTKDISKKKQLVWRSCQSSGRLCQCRWGCYLLCPPGQSAGSEPPQPRFGIISLSTGGPLEEPLEAGGGWSWSAGLRRGSLPAVC